MINAFVKNYLNKNGGVTQVLTICVTDGDTKTYKNYFLNVSEKKGTAYLSEIGANENEE